MHPSRRFILPILLTTFAFGGAPKVELTGRIMSDRNIAIEKAQVMLLATGLSAATGPDGRYFLSSANAIRTVQARGGTATWGLDGGRLRFRLASPQHVRLELFDPDGQSQGVIVDRRFPSGEHAAALVDRMAPSRTLILECRFGSARVAALAMNVDGRLHLRFRGDAHGRAPAGGLVKATAEGYLDTLQVSAPGFETRKFLVSSLEGTLDAALSPSFRGRLGETCPAAGRFAHGDGSLLVCASGKYRFALPADVPVRPAGGFTTRPEWYPTLFADGPVLAFPPGEVKFTHAPVDPDKIVSIIPYGAMIGDHVTPIDHGYLNVSTLMLEGEARKNAEYIPVVAPADGYVVEMGWLGPNPNQMRLVMAHGEGVYTVYIVLNKLGGALAKYQDSLAATQGFWNKPIWVKGGEVFGLQRDNPLDFSVHAAKAWLPGFAHPFPYVSGDAWKPFTTDPSPYFPAPIAARLEAKCQRTEAPRWGRIDWDRPGTAAGNWYREGTIGYSGNPVSEYQSGRTPGPLMGKNIYAWSHLTLAPHWVQPSVWMASLGAWSDPAGDGRQFALKPGTQRPDSVTSASGIVVYELVTYSRTDSSGQELDHRFPEPVGYKIHPVAKVEGVLAVRVNADGTLTVEKRPDLQSASAFTAFTAKAETYWR